MNPFHSANLKLNQLHKKAYRPFTSLNAHLVNRLYMLYHIALNLKSLKYNELELQRVNLKHFININS